MNSYLTIILIIDHTTQLNENNPEDKIYFKFKESWRRYMNSSPDILSLFVCVDENLKHGEYRLQPEINTIYVHGKDSLQLGILEKTLYALKYIKNHYTFDFILRTNLSCFFDFKKLTQLIKYQPKNNIFGGFIVFNSFINGGCQIISSNLIDIVVDHIDPIICSYNGSEDMSISGFLNSIVPMKNITEMFFFTDNSHSPCNCEYSTVQELDFIIKKSDADGYLYYRIKNSNKKADRSDDILAHERLYNYYYGNN